jgi:hypothetical protein
MYIPILCCFGTEFKSGIRDRGRTRSDVSEQLPLSLNCSSRRSARESFTLSEEEAMQLTRRGTVGA